MTEEREAPGPLDPGALDAGPIALEAVASLVGGSLVGDASLVVDGVAPVDQASASQLGFVAARRYLHLAESSSAGALLVSEALEQRLGEAGKAHPRVTVSDPHAALRLLLDHFHPPLPREVGIDPSAHIAAGATLGSGVSVGPYAVVETGARVGTDVTIGSHTVVGAHCVVGDGSVLHPHVVLYPNTELGRRVIVHAGARIGVDGFGYVFQDGGHQKVPQVGRCVVEDDVEIGANTCIDRGSIGHTRIGAGTKIDNQVHIAHNVLIGPRSIVVAQVGIAGSTRVGAGVMFGGQVGVVGHLEIGDGAKLAAQSGVDTNVPAGETWWGSPARPRGEYLRRLAGLGKIDDIARRLKALEAKATVADETGDDAPEDTPPNPAATDAETP